MHGILASQIATHSIFSLMHILHSPDTQDHISSFPTALAKLYYLSWHIGWLVQNAVSRHIYINCLLLSHLSNSLYSVNALILWAFCRSGYSISAVCLFVCVCVFPWVHCELVAWTMQCAETPHSPHNACLSKEPHTTPCNKVYCILQHIMNSKTSSL